MTVREAITFFREVPKITNRLRVLDEVGRLSQLGQSATTLSGEKPNESSWQRSFPNAPASRPFTFSTTDNRFAFR